MPAPFAIFCVDPLNARAVDDAFASEAEVARAGGFTVVGLDHDELDQRIDAQAALRGARFDSDGEAVYRGWMMSAAAYEALFTALRTRGIKLITSPSEYAACHHAPGSYPALAAWMPQMTWLPIAEIDDVHALGKVLKGFGSSAVVVKDWVKSQASGYWAEACFIPDASDETAVSRVVARFRELQGDTLVGGLVFKAYVPLTPVGSPAFEYRAFIVRGQIAGCWARSADAQDIGVPPAELLEAVASEIPSPFASADFGRDVDGRWWLLEVGDGQVSGLPDDPEAAEALITTLADVLTDTSA